MMEPVTVDPTCYRIAGKPVYLNSGEFHYFRVPRRDWRRRMKLFKEAGGNCLGTYVPWVVHEPEEGRFAFGERPFDQLEAFLDTAAEMGLYVMARPGPYQYSELLYAGLPPWLLRNYPQILSRNHDGSSHRFFAVSYMHPVFLDKARPWFDAVCPLLARYDVSRGGPIAFTQIDNEMIGIHIWFGGLDYHPETMGFGRADGRYPRFLQQRYGTVGTMNAATGRTCREFADAQPPAPNGPCTPPELRRRRDYLDCYLATVAEYSSTLAGWMRAHGIQTPLVHNSASPTLHSIFDETIQTLGAGFVLGADHYYTLDQNWPQNNPTPQYARKIFASLEALRVRGFPPTIYELPGGSLSDWPPITPPDALACYLANLALGMKGHNYYIFTGGRNPPDMGSTGEVYDYGAPIGARGEVRPTYKAVKTFGLFLRRRPWLCEAEAEFDFRAPFDPEWDRADHYLKGKGSFALGLTDAHDFWNKGLLTTSFCAGLSPAACSLDDDTWTTDTTTPLVVTACSIMARAKQERIVRFLEQGGRLLIGPVLPEFDETFTPCTLLRDYLGAGAVTPSGIAPTRLSVAGIRNISNTGEIFTAGSAPAGTETLGVDEVSGRVFTWRRRFRKGGAAIVHGFRWSQGMRDHERMLTALLAGLGLRRRIESDQPNAWCRLRTAGKRSMLFIMNLTSAPMEARVRCRPSWSSKWLDTGLHRLKPMQVKCVEIGPSDTRKR
jgi:beta-galactosidase